MSLLPSQFIKLTQNRELHLIPDLQQLLSERIPNPLQLTAESHGASVDLMWIC